MTRSAMSLKALRLLSLSAFLISTVAVPRRAVAGAFCNDPVPPCPGGKPCKPPPPKDPRCNPPHCKCLRSPCYVGTGNYVTGGTDLTLPSSAGFPLSVTRSYESSRLVDGPSGIGWSSSLSSRILYTTYLFAAPNTYRHAAYVIMPDGASYLFVDTGNGVLAPPAGRYDTLGRNADGSFDMTLQRSRTRYHWSPTGALQTITDEFGNTLTYIYDANGRLQQLADGSGSGRYINVYWGANGRISSIQDSAGRQVQYAYSSQGSLQTVTDPLGHITTYGAVAGKFLPLLASITDHWGRAVTTITYDLEDRTKSYTENGETFTYTYYQNNLNQTAKVDSSGNMWTYPFGSNGGLVGDDIPPAGSGINAAHIDYYGDGGIQQRIDEVGVKTYYTYDASGRHTAITEDFQGATAVRFDYAYDPNFPAKVTSITPRDPATGNVNGDWQAREYIYYQAGDPAPGALRYVKRVKSDGSTETLATYAYDVKGRLIQQVNADGGTTNYAYDATTGNLLTVTWPANNDAGTRPATTYGNYDAVGRPQTVTDALGHATMYTYDALGRVLTVTPPKPSSGSLLTFTATNSYDNFDAVTGLTFTNITDPNGKLTKLGYDQFRRTVRSVDANNKVTLYGYTKNLLTSVTDANNNVTSYSYDVLKRLTRTTFPDTLYETYSYWGDGRVKSKTDRKNQTINYGYDNRKRLKTKTYPNGSTVTYTYIGQKLTQVLDTSVSPTETHTFTYDSSYRVSGNIQATRGTLSYTYTSEDRPLTMAIAGGPTSTYTYYLDGSLNTLTWSPVAQFFKFTYRLNGQYDVVTFPNGQTRSYSYDDQGRLLHLSNALNATNLATYAYGYDVDNLTGLSTVLGRKTSMTASVPTQGFLNALTKYYYDPLYRLTRVDYPNFTPFSGEVDSWTYDAIGNRLTNTVNGVQATYAYLKNGANPLNGLRLSNDGINAYTWDSNGSNLTRSGAPGNFTFGYDVDGRLNSISGASTATYTYDYQGRRTSKTVSGATTTYLYDGLNLVGETTGGTLTNYAFGPSVDDPLIVNKTGTISYFNADGLGSVAGTNSAAGTYDYNSVFDAWGIVRSETGTRTNSFTYTGRETGEVGLHFYRARFFDTARGQFTQEDPQTEQMTTWRRKSALVFLRAASPYPPLVSYSASSTLSFASDPPPAFRTDFGYRYVRGNPVSYADPSGAEEIMPGGGVLDWAHGACFVDHYYCGRNIPPFCECKYPNTFLPEQNCEFRNRNCCNDHLAACVTLIIFFFDLKPCSELLD